MTLLAIVLLGQVKVIIRAKNSDIFIYSLVKIFSLNLGFCETINSQNNGMCRKSCAKCFYPLMQAFSSVTSQSLPAQPTPVDQWKFDRPANSSNSTTTTTKISTITTISTKGVKKN